MARGAARWSGLGLVLAVAIPALLGMWLYLRRDADVAARAVTVPARVESVRAGFGSERDPDTAVVAYTYLGRRRTTQIQGRFATGQTTSVAIDPLDPGRVWQTGTGPMSEEKAAAATIAFAVAGTLLVLGYRARFRRFQGKPPI